MLFSDHEILAWALTGFVTVMLIVIWWMIRDRYQKNDVKLEEQKELIERLFSLHDQDARELAEHRVMIAEKHYQKDELDVRFDRMEKNSEKWFVRLMEKIDNITNIVIGGK